MNAQNLFDELLRDVRNAYDPVRHPGERAHNIRRLVQDVSATSYGREPYDTLALAIASVADAIGRIQSDLNFLGSRLVPYDRLTQPASGGGDLPIKRSEALFVASVINRIMREDAGGTEVATKLWFDTAATTETINRIVDAVNGAVGEEGAISSEMREFALAYLALATNTIPRGGV